MWDTEGFNVVSGNIDTPFAAAYVATLKVDVLNFKGIDWLFRPTLLGDVSITGVTALVQFSTKRAPVEATDADWAYLPYLDVVPATGIATIRTLEQQIAVPGAAPFTLAFTNEVRGRWMRLKFKSTGGDPTNSKTTITAYRRLL